MKTTRLLATMLLAAGLLQLPLAHAVSAAVAQPLKEASELVRAGKAKAWWCACSKHGAPATSA